MTQTKANALVNRVMITLGLILVCAAFTIPIIWMVSTSLKAQQNAITYPPKLIPNPIRWENYTDVLTHPTFNFLRFARNTVIVAGLVVAGTLFSSTLAAYGFARIKFKGRGVLFAIMLSTMMIPFPVTMVSTFILFRWFGDWSGIEFLGTFKPLWLPACFGSAFNVFLLRQFFMTIPMELS